MQRKKSTDYPFPNGKKSNKLSAQNHTIMVHNALKGRSTNFDRTERHQTAIAITLGILTLGIHSLTVFLIKKYEKHKTKQLVKDGVELNVIKGTDITPPNQIIPPIVAPMLAPAPAAKSLAETNKQQKKDEPESKEAAPIEQSDVFASNNKGPR